LTIATRSARPSKRLTTSTTSDIDDDNGGDAYDMHAKLSKFTVEQETFIVNQFMDPASYAICCGPGSKFIGQQLNIAFYGKVAEQFNKKFNTSAIGSKRIMQKIGSMKLKWKEAYRMKRSMLRRGIDVSLPEMQDRIKEQCHYYFIMEPAWGPAMEARGTRPVRVQQHSPTTTSDSDADVMMNTTLRTTMTKKTHLSASQDLARVGRGT